MQFRRGKILIKNDLQCEAEALKSLLRKLMEARGM